MGRSKPSFHHISRRMQGRRRTYNPMEVDAMQNEPAKDHGLTLEGRAKLTVTGVEDVDCFSEDAAVIATAMGALTVAGAGLKVARLDLKEGRVEMTGRIDALEYGAAKKSGLLARLLR